MSSMLEITIKYSIGIIKLITPYLYPLYSSSGRFVIILGIFSETKYRFNIFYEMKAYFYIHFDWDNERQNYDKQTDNSFIYCF